MLIIYYEYVSYSCKVEQTISIFDPHFWQFFLPSRIEEPKIFFCFSFWSLKASVNMKDVLGLFGPLAVNSQSFDKILCLLAIRYVVSP